MFDFLDETCFRPLPFWRLEFAARSWSVGFMCILLCGIIDYGAPVPELTVDEGMAWPFRLRMMLAHTYDMRVGQAVCDGDAHACPACLLVWVAMFRIRIFMFSLLPSRPTVSGLVTTPLMMTS